MTEPISKSGKDNLPDNEPVKKKRGRKPKILSVPKIDLLNETKIVNSDEEKVILHLPITMNDINNSNIDINNDNEMDIFIKPNEIINNNIVSSENNDISIHDKTMILTLSSTDVCTMSMRTPNKIQSYHLNFSKNTKCWWCKNYFDSPAVQLPEDYYNNTFFCIGNFCSFNCAKSYNLNLNDTLIWKRESLLNLLYYETYSEYINIIPAPNWITLKEYGGTLTIEEFRMNSIVNTKEYLVLHPPLISRQMQIEESYKINKLKEVPLDKVNKLYSDIQQDSECIIKRTKPVLSAQYNLEKTMGLIKKRKGDK
jgi:hypothetical protein